VYFKAKFLKFLGELREINPRIKNTKITESTLDRIAKLSREELPANMYIF
jgi:hypothetical protein